MYLKHVLFYWLLFISNALVAQQQRLVVPLVHSNVVLSATFSTGGKKFITCSKDKTAKLWDVSTGKLLTNFEGHTHSVYATAFSPDEKYIMTASEDNTAKLWDAMSGKIIGSINIERGIANSYIPIFSPDGKQILAISNDPITRRSIVSVYDAASCRLLFEIKDHEGNVNTAVYSGSGKLITCLTDTGIPKIWNASTGKLMDSLSGFDAKAYARFFSPDGKMLLTISRKNKPMVWDLAAGKLVSSLVYNETDIESATFSPDNRKLVTCSKGKQPVIWDVITGKMVISLDEKIADISIAAFSPNGKKLLINAHEPVFRIRDVATGKLLLVTQPLDNTDTDLPEIKSASFSSDGEKIVTINASGGTEIRNALTGKSMCVVENIHITGRVYSAAFSPDANKVLFAHNELDLMLYTATVMDVYTGKALSSLTAHTYMAESVALSPDGKILVTTHNRPDFNAKGWDMSTGKLLYRIGHQDKWGDEGARINAVLFSADGKKIKTTAVDDTEKIWDASTGKLMSPVDLAGESNAVIIWDKPQNNNLVVSSNSKKMATALNDHTVKIWDKANEKSIFTLIPLDSFDYINLVDGGYYKSTTGAAKLLHYVTPDLKIISFEQLDVKYNRPDKVLQALGNTDSGMIRSYYNAYVKRIEKLGIDTSSFKDDYNVPVAEIVNRDQVAAIQENDLLQIHIKATDSKYKLDRFNGWINEVPLFGMKGVNIRNLNKNKLDTVLTITLSGGDNRIEVSVTNSNGMESYRMPLQVKYTHDIASNIYSQQLVVDTTKVYFIGVGINEFADSHYNLKWCVQDIRDLTKSMRNMYGSRLIIVDTLYNERATRTNIRNLKKKLFSSGVNDQVIFSYSGHGLLSKDYDYYLSSYTVNFKDPEQGGIPYDEIENMLDSIPARKKILLLDACNSGEVDKDEMKKIQSASGVLANNQTTINATGRGVEVINTDSTSSLGLQNSFELMQSLFVNVGKGTGAVIIAAAGGVQFAQERNELGHGVFTYSVIEAMKNHDLMKVSELKKYVGDKVVELTNGLQKPTTRNEPVAMDWDVW